MIIKEKEVKNRLKAKGVLVGIDSDGIHIDDEKTGDVDNLSLDDFKIFEGKFINITIADSTKTDIEEIYEIDEGEE